MRSTGPHPVRVIGRGKNIHRGEKKGKLTVGFLLVTSDFAGGNRGQGFCPWGEDRVPAKRMRSPSLSLLHVGEDGLEYRIVVPLRRSHDIDWCA